MQGRQNCYFILEEVKKLDDEPEVPLLVSGRVETWPV